MFLKPVDDTNFELKLAKRGSRAKATHPDGQWTNSVWLRHAETGIKWEQVEPPAEEAPKERGERQQGGRPSKVDEVMALGLGLVIDALNEPVGRNELARRIEDYAAKQKLDVKSGTCNRVIEKLVAVGTVLKVENGYKKA